MTDVRHRAGAATPRASDSADVTARVYHTEHGNVHLEGETYAVTDVALLETLRGCGFIQIAGWTPDAPAATGATAGTPGTFTPAGCAVPANLAALSSVTASPATAWTTGQYVALGDASQASWTGTAWVAGVAAAATRGRP